MMKNKREITLYRALWKPSLVMGCERLPFIIIMMISLLPIVQGTFMVKIGGVIFFIVFTGILSYLGKKDPFFMAILWRYLKYQDFYPSSAMCPGKKSNPNNSFN